MNGCETLRSLLKTHTVIESNATAICTIPYPDPVFRGFQGGCSDGKRYYYQVLMHYELSDRTKDFSCIAKVDLSTGETVGYSDVLHLEHANDIAYHPEKHLLLVANNKPHPNRITLVDPDTLTVVGVRELEDPVYAIEYNATRDVYLVGLSGKREFRFLDADLRRIDDRTYRTDPESDRCTKQGICADDDLLYFILWDGKHKDLPDFRNRITLYGWDSTYRGVLNFHIGPYEPESISIVNGEIYAVCVSDCGRPTVYHLAPRLP